MNLTDLPLYIKETSHFWYYLADLVENALGIDSKPSISLAITSVLIKGTFI
jgi:hypothetical protein